MKLKLLAGVATIVACAHEPSRQVPAPRELARVEACSATVAFSIGNQAGATVPIRSARMYALVPGTANSMMYDVPGKLSVSWQDSLYRTASGDTSRSHSPPIRVFSMTAGETHFDLSDEVYPRCGEAMTRALPLPMVRVIEVTSDPAGASVFLRSKSGMFSYEHKFVGVTPLNISASYEPGESWVAMRLEKSGYQNVQKQVERTDQSIRVVMQPLPTH